MEGEFTMRVVLGAACPVLGVVLVSQDIFVGCSELMNWGSMKVSRRQSSRSAGAWSGDVYAEEAVRERTSASSFCSVWRMIFVQVVTVT